MPAIVKTTQSLYFSRGACIHRVAGGGGEGMRDVGAAIGRHRVGYVDDDVDSFQRLSQTAPGDQVDTVRTRKLHHRDIAAFQSGNDAGSGRAGCSDDSNSGRGLTPASLKLEFGAVPPKTSFKQSSRGALE